MTFTEVGCTNFVKTVSKYRTCYLNKFKLFFVQTFNLFLANDDAEAILSCYMELYSKFLIGPDRKRITSLSCRSFSGIITFTKTQRKMISQ